MIDLRPTKRFDALNALRLCEFAEASYWGRQEFERHLVSWNVDRYEYFGGTETECYLAWDADSIVLSFRGTEDELDDWLTDARISKVGGIHRGFKQALDRVWPRVMKAVVKAHRGQQVYITGHSLGGALATLASMRLSSPITYTFGSPRVFSLAMARKYDKAKVNYRLVNKLDFVPRLPPRLLNYCHVGRFVYINFKDELVEGEKPWRALLDMFGTGTKNPFTRFQELTQFYTLGHHAIRAYKEALHRIDNA